MPEHVRMDFDIQSGALAKLGADIVERLPCHRTAL
jgi:hypothetical protein